jgi:hypothetical protein
VSLGAGVLFAAALFGGDETAITPVNENVPLAFDVSEDEWNAALPDRDFPDWNLELTPKRPPSPVWGVPLDSRQSVEFDVVYRLDGTIGIHELKTTTHPPFAAYIATWLRAARFKPVAERDGKPVALRGKFSFGMERRAGPSTPPLDMTKAGVSALTSASTGFAEALAAARRDEETPEGRALTAAAITSIGPGSFDPIVQACQPPDGTKAGAFMQVLRISPSGRVVASFVSEDTAWSRCLSDALASLPFPKTLGPKDLWLAFELPAPLSSSAP